MARTPRETRISIGDGRYSKISPRGVGMNPGISRPMLFSIQISITVSTQARFNQARRPRSRGPPWRRVRSPSAGGRSGQPQCSPEPTPHYPSASCPAPTLGSRWFLPAESRRACPGSLKGARSSLALKGSIVANGVTNKTLSLADSAWTSSSSTIVTVTASTTAKKEGTASANISILTAFTTGLAAYDDLAATVDLSSTDSIQLWVRSTVGTASGAIELRISSSAACGDTL